MRLGLVQLSEPPGVPGAENSAGKTFQFGPPTCEADLYSQRMKYRFTLQHAALRDRLLGLLLGCLAMALLSVEAAALPSVSADTAKPPIDLAAHDIEQRVQQMALEALGAASAGQINRVEVQFGALDSRLRLTPCSQVQLYMPPGSGLWGRTRIGLRCIQGQKAWNVFLPATIKVMAPALVASASLSAGHTLTEADMVRAEVDLAAEASPAVQGADGAVGRVLSRALVPGQSLRQVHLKARQWFAVGDVVTVVAAGPGYRAVSQGEALTAGLEGQVARVRMSGGRTLVGTPVADRQMELPL